MLGLSAISETPISALPEEEDSTPPGGADPMTVMFWPFLMWVLLLACSLRE